jgi:hypothetical protein
VAEGTVSRTAIRLRIVDAQGQAVSDGTLSVVRSTVPFPEVALIPDEQGIVEVRLPDGTFTFRAVGPGGSTGEVTVESQAAANTVVDIEVR